MEKTGSNSSHSASPLDPNDPAAIPQNSRKRSRPVLIALSAARVLIGVALVFVCVLVPALFLLQRKIIYLPRPYTDDERASFELMPQIVRMSFVTDHGSQFAYYIPPSEPIDTSSTTTIRTPPSATGDSTPSSPSPTAQLATTLPPRLWVFFGGNAMRALDWLDTAEQLPDRSAGKLLIEYPGYGDNSGSPSRAGIAANASAAFTALAARCGQTPGDFESRTEINIFGMSLGCAAALDFAVHHPVRRIILLCPFTTLHDMARQTVGEPLAYLLRDKFDNRARLDELEARNSLRPAISIYHGRNDSVVPFRMGAELARLHPQMIRFHPVDHADHNDLLFMAKKDIFLSVEEPIDPIAPSASSPKPL